MLAYCAALAVSEAWLIYAQGSHPPVTRMIRKTGIRIIEYSLDLSVDTRTTCSPRSMNWSLSPGNLTAGRHHRRPGEHVLNMDEKRRRSREN